MGPFLTWCPGQGEDLTFSGALLKNQRRKAVGKACALDGWSGDQWSLLPMLSLQYWLLYGIWFELGEIPHQWTKVRCVLFLIPKTVGLRPVSVAAVAWRIGMALVTQQLSGWIDDWGQEELIGSLKEPSCGKVHNDLHYSINQGEGFGAKLDVAKFKVGGSERHPTKPESLF